MSLNGDDDEEDDNGQQRWWQRMLHIMVVVEREKLETGKTWSKNFTTDHLLGVTTPYCHLGTESHSSDSPNVLVLTIRNGSKALFLHILGWDILVAVPVSRYVQDFLYSPATKSRPPGKEALPKRKQNRSSRKFQVLCQLQGMV